MKWRGIKQQKVESYCGGCILIVNIEIINIKCAVTDSESDFHWETIAHNILGMYGDDGAGDT